MVKQEKVMKKGYHLPTLVSIKKGYYSGYLGCRLLATAH